LNYAPLLSKTSSKDPRLFDSLQSHSILKTWVRISTQKPIEQAKREYKVPKLLGS